MFGVCVNSVIKGWVYVIASAICCYISISLLLMVEWQLSKDAFPYSLKAQHHTTPYHTIPHYTIEIHREVIWQWPTSIEKGRFFPWFSTASASCVSACVTEMEVGGQSEAGGGRCFATQPIRTAESCKPGTTLLNWILKSRERRAVIGQ